MRRAPLPESPPMTRLSGGRDGIEAITPEDFIGLDSGPGDRTGLLALAANEEIALLAIPDAMRFFGGHGLPFERDPEAGACRPRRRFVPGARGPHPRARGQTLRIHLRHIGFA